MTAYGSQSKMYQVAARLQAKVLLIYLVQMRSLFIFRMWQSTHRCLTWPGFNLLLFIYKFGGINYQLSINARSTRQPFTEILLGL